MEITTELLCDLFKYRWSAPILAELSSSDGCKYVTLRHRLVAADGPLRQTLDWLISLGWVMRNPGYGHPSRPEYILTPIGQDLALICESTVNKLSELGVTQIGLNRWSIPVLHSIAAGARRFIELRKAVPAITPRALTQTLRDLAAADLTTRQVTSEIPVAIAYHLTHKGHTLADLWR